MKWNSSAHKDLAQGHRCYDKRACGLRSELLMLERCAGACLSATALLPDCAC